MPAEIAIVGGGPAGLCLAGILESNGYDYVVYERTAKETVPRGGCLDLREWSGQRALKDAGCWDAWNEIARRGEAEIMSVVDEQNNLVIESGREESHGSPEADRSQLKAALLTSVPDEKIRWSTGVDRVRRDDTGSIILEVSSGETVKGHKLVVGADGVWSKVRSMLTQTTPKFSGVCIVPRFVLPTNPHFSEVKRLAGPGAFVVLGHSTLIWIQMQGAGHYRMEFGWLGEEDYDKSEVDLSNEDQVKASLLRHDRFGKHAQVFQDLIEASTGPSHPWKLYHMLPESLSWEASADVTLIGDAAHATVPFVGEGANNSLHDTSILFNCLREHGLTKTAISEYEKSMFARGADIIRRSLQSQQVFFRADGAYAFKTMMESSKPLIRYAENGVA